MSPIEPPESEKQLTGPAELSAIVRALGRGEPEALRHLYDAVGKDLFAFGLWLSGRRDLAADAVQEVFLKLAARPGLPADVRKPKSYLLTAVRRAVVDQVRADDRYAEFGDAPLVVAPVTDPGRTVDGERAAAALGELSEEQRETVFLRHFQDLSFREVGRITGVSTFTAASRYRLAIKRLQRTLGVSK